MRTVLYLVAAVYFAVIRTVHTLKDASKKMANGELSVRVDLHTEDELKTVGTYFNHMADAFIQMIGERDRVKDELLNQNNLPKI